MKDKKLFLFVVLSIFLVSIISAQEVSSCCERLGNSGPWCQNAPENQCGSNYRSAPTSCEATSYCRLGVCINSKEGTCLPNTPQRVCDDNEGIWDERDKDDIPQCQLGCCLIGEQAAFVTLTRCKSLSSIYGLEINYRTDIQSEVECIANARPKVKGACVYEREYEKTCKLLTKKECQEMEIGSEDLNVEFHENYLCSADELTTNCAATTKTTCVEGRDEVYFLDSCGNLANVYDAGKGGLNYKANYWTYIAGTKAGVEVDCGSGSDTCGNCDYFLGTTCKAVGGKHVCKDLSCKYEGQPHQHGETWCADAKGISTIKINDEGGTSSSGEDLPGGRHFRLICYNGEVSVEPCADFRQEVCIQSSIGNFKTAACRVNLWQDCYSQDNQKDCENLDKRDCQWFEDVSILTDENGESLAVDEDGEKTNASCIPKYSPGFNFWEQGGDAESMCSMASTECIVQYEKAIIGVWTVSGGEENITCLDNDEELVEDWAKDRIDLCMGLGDCGISKNYINVDGYYDDTDDLFTITGNLTGGKKET